MERTQFGWIFFIVIVIIAGVVIYQNQNLQATIILLMICVILLLLFYKLTITVSEEYVKFSFGIGLIKGKYNLKDIARCQPIHYIPLGWGIRLRPGVILFNVSGNKAIELEIKNKNRKVWIGTNVPQEIADYINLLIRKD